MARARNQTLKALYLAKILSECTDSEHYMSMPEILSALAENGIDAERKSLYDDIEALKLIGIDIKLKSGKYGGYYIDKRNFGISELRLLVDTVQSARFITAKKSNELIKKLEGLTSRYKAHELQSQVYVANRIKSMNESIYTLVDDISRAIVKNRKITFEYLEWTLDKTKVPKNNGELYKVSPKLLTWDDENYYMVAYDEKSKKTKHYRVDKMQSIKITDEKRDNADEDIDVAAFSKKVFGMFGGKEESVSLECDNSMIGVIMDRFGQDIPIMKHDGYFTTRVSVMVSPQFYAFIVSLGGEVSILSPESVRDDFYKFVGKSIKKKRK